MTDPLNMSFGEPDLSPDTSTNPTGVLLEQQQAPKNISKRTKINNGDDSYERAHRLVGETNQYFNNGDSRQNLIANTDQKKPKEVNSVARRPSFPPFRISFSSDNKPSELSIIKHVNKYCRTTISYGRYSSSTDNKVFLIYANSSSQFDYLMDKKVWPTTLCELDYTIDLPTKVPTAHSLIVLGIPTQWNLMDLEIDFKKQYSSIIKVERLYIKNRVPISKVRIDFSSNEHLQQILKQKKLLLDDEHTSFKIQPYIPPIQVLRCFNCQQYDDHISSNCPRKDHPVCFRCGQDHPFDPNCRNEIRCANCKQEHMAGNPNCSFKIQARKNLAMKAAEFDSKKPVRNKASPPPSVWNNPTGVTTVTKLFHPKSPTYNNNNRVSPIQQVNTGPSDISILTMKLDILVNKIETLIVEQTNTNRKMDILNKELNQYNKALVSTQHFLFSNLCPYINKISTFCLNSINQKSKERLENYFSAFKNELHNFETNSSNLAQDQQELLDSPYHEPNK